MMMVMRMWTLVWIDFQIHSAGSPSKKDHLDNIFFSGRKKSHQYKTFSEFGKGGDTWTPWGYFVCFGTFFWFYFLVCVLFNPFPHLRDDVTKKFDSAESYIPLAKWPRGEMINRFIFSVNMISILPWPWNLYQEMFTHALLLLFSLLNLSSHLSLPARRSLKVSQRQGAHFPLTAVFFSKEFSLHFLVTITSVQFVRLSCW